MHSFEPILEELGCAGAAVSRIGGGCINESVRVGEDLFVKRDSADKLEIFEAEAAALREIAATRTVRVPEVVASGRTEEYAWLALEHISLRRMDATTEARLGTQLAAMHRVSAEDFGWSRDNFIGATPQSNTHGDDWARFFADERIAPQVAMAAGRFARGDELLEKISELLSGHRPVASLLHGDLWGGNAAADADGNPVIYDPATYYGDRETDIAFTEMFGGFGSVFYRSYRDAFPLNAGYEKRKPLYNLYHVLNHFNLFGGGYAAQAEELIDELCGRVSL